MKKEHFLLPRAPRTYIRLLYNVQLEVKPPDVFFSVVTVELSIRAISAQLGLSFALFLSLYMFVSPFQGGTDSALLGH